MTQSRLRASAAMLAAPLLIWSAGAAAHHGWGWTEDEETELSGTIEKISFTNPHMHITLKADDDSLWAVDLSPPIIAERSGFGPEAAKAGDSVVLTGHRARDRETRGFKAETVTVNGKTYDVYPQREKTLASASAG